MDIFPQIAQGHAGSSVCANALHYGACAHSSHTPSDTAPCPQFLAHRRPTEGLGNRGRMAYARTQECGDRTEWGPTGHSCPIPRLHKPCPSPGLFFLPTKASRSLAPILPTPRDPVAQKAEGADQNCYHSSFSLIVSLRREGEGAAEGTDVRSKSFPQKGEKLPLEIKGRLLTGRTIRTPAA